MHSLSLLAISLIPGRAFWPYFAGAVPLALGLAVIIKNKELRQAQGIDKALVFSGLFLAVPMGVFGADHFIAPAVVASLVPSWIPGHLFWTYFVGTALFAASLSIVARKYAALAATLLGLMLLLFVLLMHMPFVTTHPGNRFAWAILLRDTSFAGGALALATTQMKQRSISTSHRMLLLVRLLIAVPAVVFGVEHFLHPQFVPVIPLRREMPSWIPGQLVLSYLTGAALIVCGSSILLNWRARLAALWLGTTVFVVVMLVYLPILITSFTDINSGLNYFADTLVFSGAALALAGALPRETAREYEESRSAALSNA